VTTPFLLVQLSDPHIGASWAGVDPTATWQAAIDTVRSLPDQPDAAIVTGDLTEQAAAAEYAVIKSGLDSIGVPAYVLPGNHDDRAGLRAQFGSPGSGDEPVHYAADLGTLRLAVLDTTRPGHADGELAASQLDWLESELSGHPDRTTVLAMHHPPFPTGMPAWDAIGLAAADRAALGAVVRRHPQVLRIVSGHVHRAFTAELGGCVALSAPSTYVQARPRFGDCTELEFSDDVPAAFAIHAIRGTEILSYVQPVVAAP
jgi:3',5'-cyclic-AMP phosphodiesterase